MKRKFLYRILFVVSIFALIAGAMPKPAMAASPFVSIVSVKADDSVTVRATGLPANVTFKARMDVSGSLAVNGILVGETKSGSDGKFEATYKIPAELKGKDTITIRIDGTGGYFAYNWFNNKTQTSSGSTPTTTPTTTTKKNYYMEVIAVEKNKRITVHATGFPKNTDFEIRIGAYYNFSKQHDHMGWVNTGNGDFNFNVNLPSIVKDVSLLTIRLDSKAKQYSYNAFKNVDLGTVSSNPDESTSTGYSCQVISVTPTNSLTTRYDFDAVWTVKNNGTADWKTATVDYKYVSGDKLQKKSNVYDLPKTVKAGETVKIIVDMTAPNTAGTYTTQWALVNGSSVICNLPVTITVK